MAEGYGGRVRFVEENYGSSELARRFGVTRYPAIFVNDILAATPDDFGFYGKAGGSGGRYAPIREAAGQERFRAELTRMLDLALAGRTAEARARGTREGAAGPAAWPSVAFADLDGRTLEAAALKGKPTVVEMWATWCPPCRSTLRWLGELKRRMGDDVQVVAIAVESDSAAVVSFAKSSGLPIRFVRGTPDLARAFGDVSAVPTLHLFDGNGQRVETYFGAPPDLHARVEKRLAAIAR